jgi:hypothetical protein
VTNPVSQPRSSKASIDLAWIMTDGNKLLSEANRGIYESGKAIHYQIAITKK